MEAGYHCYFCHQNIPLMVKSCIADLVTEVKERQAITVLHVWTEEFA